MADPGTDDNTQRASESRTSTVGRELVPIRRQPRRYKNAHHERLFAEEDRLKARIDEVDAELVALTEERRGAARRHPRRPPSAPAGLVEDPRPAASAGASDEEPLPPTSARPTWVFGR